MSDHTCPDCGAVYPEKRVSLKQRVEVLEEKVRSLEARIPWTWTTTPSYFTTGTTTTDDSTTLVVPD